MDVTITPHELSGQVRAVASKSEAHRVLICAAFADAVTDIDCNTTSQDIEATILCLEALGARVASTPSCRFPSGHTCRPPPPLPPPRETRSLYPGAGI